MQQKLNLSHDGSHTVYSDKFKAHYHSVFGAIEESIHVFISAGIYYLKRKGIDHISIFEMGFGTGLNAYLSLLESIRLGININYMTVESDPLEKSISKQLNYAACLNNKDNYLNNLHELPWGEWHKVIESFCFQKRHEKIQELDLSLSHFDMIYYDAFAPSCQSELWTVDVHEKLYNQLNQGGILVTYCTQGQFKRNLKAIGYKLETLNGPGKKREMLRAIKS